MAAIGSKLALLMMITDVFMSSVTYTQWLTTGKRLSTIPSDVNIELPPFTKNGNICSDGSGGVVIVWDNSSPSQLRIQHLNRNGQELWQTGGLVLAQDSAWGVYGEELITTSDGNFVAIWVAGDYPGNLYAQQITVNGQKLWGDSGIAVCSIPLTQYFPQVSATSDGGVVVVWMDFRSGFASDIYAQRLASDGSRLWQADGVPIAVYPCYQNFPQIAHAGNNRFVIVWEDCRNFYFDIMANMIDSSGSKLWGTNDLTIYARTGNTHYPKILTDESGYSYVTWEHNTRGQYDIRAQKIDPQGNLLWGDGVIPVDTMLNTTDPFLTLDGNGGIYVGWTDSRQLYPLASVQRIRSDGSLAFADSGVYVSSTAAGQSWPVLAGDSQGGCIIAWNDHRNTFDDVRCQRIDSSGTLLWQSDGVSVAVGNDHQRYPQLALTDSGNSVVIWIDRRDGTFYHLYASKVRQNGDIVTRVDDLSRDIPITFSLAQNYPNPFNSVTRISFHLPLKSFVSIKILDILGREIATIVSEELLTGTYTRDWNPVDVASGVYLYRMHAGSYVESKKLVLLK